MRVVCGSKTCSMSLFIHAVISETQGNRTQHNSRCRSQVGAVLMNDLLYPCYKPPWGERKVSCCCINDEEAIGADMTSCGEAAAASSSIACVLALALALSTRSGRDDNSFGFDAGAGACLACCAWWCRSRSILSSRALPELSLLASSSNVWLAGLLGTTGDGTSCSALAKAILASIPIPEVVTCGRICCCLSCCCCRCCCCC
mmetsp:Transcript_18174/g.50452  ORF Transcript_18174/g.50452 Transcript_18174/m.50452 type:complete len:202 (+) Transcript_18174:137-742(+)